jgi:hypothetical protein
VNRSSLVLAGLALSVAAAGIWFLLRSQRALPDDPLAVVPRDASALLSVRLSRVLESPAWERLVVARGGARGIQRATASCGFIPLAGIRQLTVFARFRQAEDKPRFAFAARGKLDHARLLDCASKLAGRGGLAVEQEQLEGIPGVRSKNGGTRVVFLGSSGMLAGDAEGVHAAVLTLLEKQPSLAQDSALRSLYSEQDARSELALVARDLRRLGPLIELRLGRAFDPSALGLDDVDALGAQLRLDGERIAGSAQLLAKTPARAASIVQRATRERERLLDLPGIGLTGLSRPLRAARFEAHGQRAEFSGEVALRAAEALLDLLDLL